MGTNLCGVADKARFHVYYPVLRLNVGDDLGFESELMNWQHGAGFVEFYEKKKKKRQLYLVSAS